MNGRNLKMDAVGVREDRQNQKWSSITAWCVIILPVYVNLFCLQAFEIIDLFFYCLQDALTFFWL
jgi:hypothetical protein